MTIKVWVRNEKKNSKYVDLGIDRPIEGTYHLVELTFDDTKLRAVWVFPEEDEETGSQDMVFYTDFGDFRTPYDLGVYNELRETIEYNQLRG